MASSKFNAEKAAEAVALADFLWNDKDAAKKLGIADRTIRGYRERATREPQFAELIQQKKKAIQAEARDWAPEAAHTLKVGVLKIRELITQAKVEDLRAVVGAVKILGDLDIVRDFLSDEQRPEPDRESDADAQAPRRPQSGSTADEDHPVH